jgi:hypothetical protein
LIDCLQQQLYLVALADMLGLFIEDAYKQYDTELAYGAALVLGADGWSEGNTSDELSEVALIASAKGPLWP